MLRWQARLSEPIRPGESRDDYNTRMSDYLHAFFVTCYHVSDALEKDPLAVSVHGTAKNYADTSPWLSKCHLIALGSKHIIIDKGPHQGTSPRIDDGKTERSETLWGVPSPRGTLIVPDSYFDIEINGQRHLALPAVDECVREWNEFLQAAGLLP